MGGIILSALVRPWFLATLSDTLLFSEAAMRASGAPRVTGPFGLGVFNLFSGYVTAMALRGLVVKRQNRSLAWHVLGLPVYWVLISFAAYLAFWQLAFAPCSL